MARLLEDRSGLVECVGLGQGAARRRALVRAEVARVLVGTDDPAEYAALLFSPRLVSGQIQNVGRVYAGSQVSYELTPLATAAAAVLVNLDDGSGLVNPTLSYSLGDESSLLVGAIVPWGAEPDGGGLRSEYGSYFTALWVQWRWSF